MKKESTPDDPTVFVVDDDPDVCQSIALMTQAMGVKCSTFSSAEKFLAEVTSQPLGCLITDFRMLGMSGVELLSAIAERGWKVPTILVTAYADVRLAVDAVRAGAMTLLEKPYREQELWSAIDEALNVSRSLAESIERQNSIKERLSLLTPEEFRVLREMIEGTPNKVIATELDIAPRTVDLRRQSVLRKLEAQSAIHVLRIFSDAGLSASELLSKHQTGNVQ